MNRTTCRRPAPSGSRFGSLLRAYQMIGYEPERDYRYVEINRALRQAHPGIVAQILDGIAERGGQAVQDPDTDLIRINGEFTASVVLARCFETQGGSLRWRIRLDTGLRAGHHDCRADGRIERSRRAIITCCRAST